MNSNGKIRVDAADLSLREHAAAVDAAAPYADHAASADYVVAGMVWQTVLRTDPTFTYEQALDLKFADLEIVGGDGGDADPEADGAETGASPQSSAALGESVPAP